MTEQSFNWTGEQERRDALAEVTKLRRDFDTTTAKGAKAFANNPEAQAALARLDAAKTGVGMRTSAQDLTALNKIDGSKIPTGITATRGGAAVTATPTSKTERATTQALNAPSKEYFKSVTQAFRDPNNKPLLRLPEVTDAIRETLQNEWTSGDAPGWESLIDSANYEWKWVEPGTLGNKKGYWGMAINARGILTGPVPTQEEIDSANSETASDLVSRLWRTGKYSLEQVSSWAKQFNPAGLGMSDSGIVLEDLLLLFPEITSVVHQRVINEMIRNNNWPPTIEKYKETYRELKTKEGK